MQSHALIFHCTNAFVPIEEKKKKWATTKTRTKRVLTENKATLVNTCLGGQMCSYCSTDFTNSMMHIICMINLRSSFFFCFPTQLQALVHCPSYTKEKGKKRQSNKNKTFLSRPVILFLQRIGKCYDWSYNWALVAIWLAFSTLYWHRRHFKMTTDHKWNERGRGEQERAYKIPTIISSKTFIWHIENSMKCSNNSNHKDATFFFAQ